MRVYHDLLLVPGSRSTFSEVDPDPAKDPDPAQWYGSVSILIKLILVNGSTIQIKYTYNRIQPVSQFPIAENYS